MSKLLDLLEAFNRKERFFLFTQATDNPGFILGNQFRKELSKATDTDTPADAKAYIDYHLDWLHAAVILSQQTPSGDRWPNKTPDDQFLVSTGNQEDVDLLIAFDRGVTTSLIFVEAKTESGWTNSQLISKANRLKKIPGSDDFMPDAPIRPVFCLASPRRPVGLLTTEWPTWMLRPSAPPDFRWLQLHVPAGRKKVEGCDINGKPSQARSYWTVRDLTRRGAGSE